MFGLLIFEINAGNNDGSGTSIQKMKYESFLELVKKRRSIRQFKPYPIPDDYIKKIIEAARWAPSGYNSQLWEFVVVRKPAIKNQIAEIINVAFEEMMKTLAPPGAKVSASTASSPVAGISKAPAFILVLGDTRVRKYGPPFMKDEHKWLTTYIPSLAISYQYVALAATSLGLASHWVSAVNLPTVPEQIRELIGIPEEMVFFDMLVVGFPDKEPPDKKMRPLEEMLHFDDCGIGDFRTEEQVKTFFGK
jgi:nitroreductase